MKRVLVVPWSTAATYLDTFPSRMREFHLL
jgi:hypothetical protein